MPRYQTKEPDLSRNAKTDRAAFAGSLFSLLDWWIDKGLQADPEEMDALFHRLAWRGVLG